MENRNQMQLMQKGATTPEGTLGQNDFADCLCYKLLAFNFTWLENANKKAQLNRHRTQMILAVLGVLFHFSSDSQARQETQKFSA